MKTTVETITPNKAKEYLAANKINRQLRAKTVELYASEMSLGRWLLTHQGIAFDETGALADGQHRLHAIVLANKPVTMQVTRGMPVSVKNGIEVFSMDAVDRGKTRSIPDQLYLRHGHKNCNVLAACCVIIADICCSTRRPMTVAKTLEIIHLFKNELAMVTGASPLNSALRKSTVYGAMAFVIKAEPEFGEQFLQSYLSGEGLRKGDPAHTLREYASGFNTGSGASRRTLCLVTLNMAMHAFNNSKITRVYSTTQGADFWKNKQKSRVEAVKDIMTLVPD